MAAKIKNALKSFVESMMKVRQEQVDRMIKENGWRNLQ